MRIDGLQLTEGSHIGNMTIATGTTFPSSPNSGELFFRTDGGNIGLYVHDGSSWNKCFTSADPITLPSNTTPGTYTSVTVSSQGIVTAGTNPTTLSGYGITDAQALDADLTAIAGLAGTSGILTKTAANTWSLDTNTYLTGNQTITLTGGLSGSGTTSINATVVTNANLTGVVTSVGNATSIANGAITNAMLANSAVANLSGTNTGDQTSVSGNAGTATALQTPRTIAGTSFDGTANINISYANLTGLPTLGTAAAKNIPATGDASATEVVYGTDSRLTDARPANGGNAATVTNGVYTTDTGTVTNTMLAGSIANAKLLNSSLTIGSTNIALGATSTTLTGLTSVTSTSFVGALTGNASTATSATTAGTVTTAAQPAITSVGTLTSLAVTGDVSSGSVTTNGVTINSGNIYRAGGTAPAYYMSQDGTGRQHWYWNTGGGLSPTFSVANEDATDIMMSVNNSGIGGTFIFRTADGVGKSAGQALTWTNAMTVTTTNATFTGALAGSNLSGTNTGDETTATIKSKLGITTLSGSNTGDQTITLTGGVTGSGTGSFAATVVTNANLTGPITSVGNTTSIASQTGTGTTFVMSAGPTLTGTTSTAALTSSGLITANAGITVPTGQVITIVDQPSSGTSAANKNYVDAVAAGLAWKNSVKAATTGAITLSAPQTIDGVSVVAGDRVLVKNQASAATNGIYVVAAGAWTRSTDMDSSTPINEFNGAGVHVVGGTTQANTSWTVSSTIVTVGTDAVNWAQFSGASVVAAGTGITLTGNTISLTNNSLTIGSTNIALGATSTTLAGLTSVTSTSFVGALTGNASSATNIAGGVAGNVHYQSGVGATAFVSNAAGVLQAATSGATPAWTTAPSISGANLTAGSVFNVALVNSSLTVGSTNIALGATSTTLAGLTSVTSTSFVGALTGNASTATTLATARNINGVSFNGSADITVTAAAGTLSGATLNSTVTASSLTSVGTLTALNVNATATMTGVTIDGIGNVDAATLTTSATTPNQVVDTVATATYRSIKYIISVTSSTSYHYTEVNIIHDGTTAYVNEINTMFTGSSLATFDAAISAGNLTLTVTPTNAVTTIKAMRLAIAV